MRNFGQKIIRLTLSLMLFTFLGLNSVTAQLDEVNELPCDSLIQVVCDGETLEFSVCEIDWESLSDCYIDLPSDASVVDWDLLEDLIDFDWDDYDYDWDWTEDSVNFDWDWDFDTTGYELPCDSLIQFECNGETLEFSVCEIDWESLSDCYIDLPSDVSDVDWDLIEDLFDFDWDDYDYDWDWTEDSVNFDWDWDFDTTGYELPCDSLIQFECNGETLEFSVCEIDWESLSDCYIDLPSDVSDVDWDWIEDLIDFDWDDYDYDWDWTEDSINFDWDWIFDTTGYELPCDSLIQFECNGETLEFSVCEIDWEVLNDCFNGTQEVEEEEVESVQEEDAIETPVREDQDNNNNPVITGIFPNPVINDLYINITTYERGSIEIMVTDIKGSVVHQEQGVELSGGGKYIHPINFETKLPMGMYRVSVTNSNNQIIASQNFIKAD